MRDDLFPSEVYLNNVELSLAQKDAIETLTGVHPDDYFEAANDESDPDDLYETWQVELMIFLVNAVQFAHAKPFSLQSLTGIAHLSTYAEYLMDAMHLMSKSKRLSPQTMILAAVAASIATDVQSQDGNLAHLDEALLRAFGEAQDMLHTCLGLAGNG